MSAPAAEVNATECCPKCGINNSTVIDSRPRDYGRYRRRRCMACNNRWNTIEVPVEFARAVHQIGATLDDTANKLVDLAGVIDALRRELPMVRRMLREDDAC